MPEAKVPDTLREVRDGLSKMYADVMNDRRMCPQVHEGANALGKVINTCRAHLEACKLAGKKPSGEWMEYMGVTDASEST